MALQVLINGVDRSSIILWPSLNWKPAVTNKVDTLSFRLFKFGSRTYAPAVFDEVEFYDGGTLVFSGTIIQFSENVEAVERQIYNITCKDRTHELDRRLVIERYTRKPLINIICDILNRYVNKGSRLEIATFEPNEVWQGDGAVDTVHYRVADQARKLTSTNAVPVAMYRDILVDLEPTGYDGDDFIEMDVYVDTVANLGSSVMKLGNADLSAYFSANITSQLTADGWNMVRVAKEDFSVTGSPTWPTIARIRLEVTSVASQTVQVTFDNWQEVKTTAFTRDGANSMTQTVEYIACNYEPASKIFQRLADFFQLQWYVNPNRAISFFARFDNMAPFNLSDTSGNYVYESLTVNNGGDQLRNAIFVRGGDYLAASRTDSLSQQADGANKVFVLGYKFANYSMTVDGVAQAIGLDNLQDYTDNEAASQNRTGGTALSLGDAAARTKQAQQVIVTSSGKRSKILLRIKKVGAPVDNFQVQIFSDTANAPSGTNLSTVATLAGGSITTSFAEYTFTLTAASAGLLTLTEPTSYHIVCSRSGANDASNYYQIDAVTTGSYEGIHNVYNASWAAGSGAFYFTEKIDFDALYSFNEKIVTFPTAPAGGTTILWTGQPYLPIIVRYADAASVSTYGEFEFRVIDPSIRTQAGARQRANVELMSFAQKLQDCRFVTRRSGLQVGQTINVQSTIRGLDMNLIIMSISAKARSGVEMIYEISCALTRTMGILYWLQDQISKDSSNIVIDDNELFDRVDSLAESVYPTCAWASNLLSGYVWSNDAGTTPNRGMWNGGAAYIWI